MNDIGAVSVELDGTTLAVVAFIVLLAIGWGAWKLGKLLWLVCPDTLLGAGCPHDCHADSGHYGRSVFLRAVVSISITRRDFVASVWSGASAPWTMS